jgi:serine/threonine protein kinase
MFVQPLIVLILAAGTSLCSAWSPTQQPQQQQVYNPYRQQEVQRSTTVVDEIKKIYVPMKASTVIHTLKSDVFKAQRRHVYSGQPTGEQVVVKISLNHGGMKRESENYDALSSPYFVQKYEFYEATHANDASAIVMECGYTDVTNYIHFNAPLAQEDIWEKAKAMTDVIAELHYKNVVWCEVKTCNFVIVNDGTIKGIDLESATYAGTYNIMHTASGTPPEFGIEHLCGRNAHMDLSFDVWGLGMVFYKLAVGEQYFTPRYAQDDYLSIFTYLRQRTKLNFSKLDASYADPRFKELVMACLDFDAARRPTIQQILAHPYFTEPLVRVNPAYEQRAPMGATWVR